MGKDFDEFVFVFHVKTKKWLSYDPTVSNPQKIAYGLPRYVPFCPTTGTRGHNCQPNQYFQLALDYE